MLSRRDLLGSVAAACAFLAAGCARDSGAKRVGPAPGPSYQQPIVENWTRSICGLCPVGCPLELGVRGGQIVSLKGIPTSPVNFGRICAKGMLMPKALTAGSRAKAFLLREDMHPKGRSDGFKEHSLEQVLEQAAGRIRQAGPQGVYFYLGAQLQTEALYLWNKLARAHLGTHNVSTSGSFAASAAAAGLAAAFGSPFAPGSFADLDTADLFVLAGSNPADTHPALFYRLMANKRKRHAKAILIDPRISPSAVAADLHLRPRPGTDAMLLHAIAAQLVMRSGHAPAFVGRSVSGFEDFAKTGTLEAVAAAAAETGVPVPKIEAAAAMIAAAPTMTSLIGSGLAGAPGGAGGVQALANLHLLTGQLGRPGSGLLTLAGGGNAMGARVAGAYPDQLPGLRRIADPQHRRQTEELWSLPPGRIPAEPGLAPDTLPQAIQSGQIKVLVLAGVNPAVSMGGIAQWRRLLKQVYVVAVDSYHPTESTIYADAVIPAAQQWGESEGVIINSERRLELQELVVPPPGKAMPDWEIAAQLAQRLGAANGFAFKSAAEVWTEWQRVTAGTPADMAGAARDRLKPVQGLQFPVPEKEHNGTARLYSDGRFPGLPAQRAVLAPPPAAAAPGQPPSAAPGQPPAAAGFPFTLITGRYLEHVNTRTRTGMIQELNYAAPRALLEISHRDAAGLGIKDNDWVDVASAEGAITVKARITDRVSPLQLFLPIHYGHLSDLERSTEGRGDPEAAVNLLTPAGSVGNVRSLLVQIQRSSR